MTLIKWLIRGNINIKKCLITALLISLFTVLIVGVMNNLIYYIWVLIERGNPSEEAMRNIKQLYSGINDFLGSKP